MARRLRETPLKDFMTYWENLPLFESQKALPKKVRVAVRANRLANDPEALAKCVECAGQHRMPSYRETTAALRDLGLRGYPALYLAAKKTQNTASSQQAARGGHREDAYRAEGGAQRPSGGPRGVRRLRAQRGDSLAGRRRPPCCVATR